MDSFTYHESPIGNYYGNIAVAEVNGKCFMSVENHDGRRWTKISNQLYDIFRNEFPEMEASSGSLTWDTFEGEE